MAVIRSELAVRTVDGFLHPEILVDATTQIGIFAELRGANATVATHACRLTKGSAYVDLTTAPAAGEVTADVTAANLVTLGAGINDIVTGWWEGTVTDGSKTPRFRIEVEYTVRDRLYRSGVRLQDLEVQLPDIGKGCTYPNDQTSWWPQLNLVTRRVRNRLERVQGGFRAYAIAHPEDVYDVEFWAACAEIAYIMAGTSKGQVGSLGEQAERYGKEYERAFSETSARLKLGAEAWQTEATKTTVQTKPGYTSYGLGANGPGGPL